MAICLGLCLLVPLSKWVSLEFWDLECELRKSEDLEATESNLALMSWYVFDVFVCLCPLYKGGR